jgi:putative radical SAM enzyme (TIGR03279 family)
MAIAAIVSVAPSSPADRAGLNPGDELLGVNGAPVRDVIEYQSEVDGAVVEIEIRRGGLERSLIIEKKIGEPLGLVLSSPVFDQVQTCDNHCPFCFIYQLPPGLRRSLSVKDDDYRLSFLYGNFTTLTRFTEADLERVVSEGLSPLYVSIHATNPHVRSDLLRNSRGATSLRWLRALLDAGVIVHGQIVVCPGLNDGLVLEETLLGIYDEYPELTSVGVVPVGISSFNKEDQLLPHSSDDARLVIDTVERWALRFKKSFSRSTVYASDEYYILAERPFPKVSDYENLDQHENGIGMAASFQVEVGEALKEKTPVKIPVKTGFFSSVDGAPATGYRSPRFSDKGIKSSTGDAIVIITSDYGNKILSPMVDIFRGIAGKPVRVLPVPNIFFGGNIAATGLLTGTDIAQALIGESPGNRYLLSDISLSNGQFLDGTTPAELPLEVEVIDNDGAALVAALRS